MKWHINVLLVFAGIFLVILANASEIKEANLRSKDSAERAMGARIIAETGNYEAGDIELLIDCFSDKTRLIPSNAAFPMGGPFSTDQRETTTSKEAERAIVRIGKPAVQKLVQALNSNGGLWRYEAARCLGEIGAKSALPDLIKLAEQGEYGRPGARLMSDEIPIAIAKISRKDAYDVLERIYQTALKNKQLNAGLFWALGYSQDERFIPVLQKGLEEGDRSQKLSILIALGHTDSEKAIALLMPYINSKDWHMKNYSRNSLMELGHNDLIPK